MIKKMTGTKERPIRVLITKVGLDGHERGAKVIASMLKEAGMEVIYLGLYQTPEGIVKAALEEDVDVIGVSFLSGEHLIYTPLIAAEMKKRNLDGVLFIAGGAFPPEDIPRMKAMGLDEVFIAGTLTQPIVEYLREKSRRLKPSP
jgi:methylmalonyl-CoA mutase C-terminal domain/subunit